MILISELAEKLKIHPKTIEKWIKKGTIKFHLLPNGSKYFEESEIADVLEYYKKKNCEA